MQKSTDMEFEIAKFQLQRIDNEIKAIRDISTLLLGYLVIVMATLVSFIFTDSSLGQVRLLAGALLIIFAANASVILAILAASFESPSDNKLETVEMLNEKIEARLQKLKTLKIWFRFSLSFAFVSLISVCSFAVNSLV